MEVFLFQKQNPFITQSRQMTQIQKKKKNGRPFLEKKDSSEDIFNISFNHT